MTKADSELEQLTKAYGQEIFARLQRDGPLVFSPAWAEDRLMEWTMHDEAVKLQLFRFIDVLPLLNDPNSVSRHLREYFGEADQSLPGWVRAGLHWLPQNGWTSRWLSRLAHTSATRLARKFIAGSNLKEALQTIAALRRRRLAFTVDLLGEATITEMEARQYQQAYLDLIEGLTAQVNRWPASAQIDCDQHGAIPRVNVSVKLSSLYSQFDPIDPVGTSRAVRERLRPIFRAAKERGAFINIDMEQYSYKDITLQILHEILEEPEFRTWPDVGVAIQAYLCDCEDDLHQLLEWTRRRGTPLWVRLIKGAYWDYETVLAAQEDWPVPVFTDKAATDANYEKLSRFLLDNHDWLRPAFGSHNVRSLACALAYAQQCGLPPGSFEVQMLYGMADPVKDALVAMGQRVRVYTPYGELLPGMAYLVRRLLENTSNESFLRASFTENTPEDQLLMNPLHKIRAGHAVAGGNGKPESTAGFRNEPISDFSRSETRQAMQQALGQVRSQFGRTYPLVIDGRAQPNDQTFASINPARFEEVVGHCGKATPEQARQAVAAAHRACPAWRDADAGQRADLIVRAAEVMRRRRYELAAWQVFECGKQWREADADVAEAIDFCRYYAHEMRKLSRPHSVNVPGEDNETIYEGRGVVVVIAPWNFPLAILTGMTTAALVTGNTVVMKPAEQSSVMAAKLMEVFQEIELPAGVVNYLPGIGEEIGPDLVGHPEVAMIAFTGSRTVGVLINKQAADQPSEQDHIKRVLAELGGKNAIIIDDDADLDEAVEGVAVSAFGYQGQKCSACSRAIVLESIHDAFLHRLVEATASLKIAPPEEPSSMIGPVIDDAARRRIEEYIARGKAEARLAYAGDAGALAQHGYFVGPHIFADVSRQAVIAQEEIFGPVLAVLRARDLDDALQIANGTSYALTGGFYSRSPANIRRVRQGFRVGNLYINRKITGALVQRQPFGGFKMSGIGSKAGGPDYLLQFCLPRTITENTMRRGFAPATDPGHGEP
jgi:RHH-type proline utilization regulon transcriptional repressor/proline dehydrogenase/delta 1-pyrroline-5-carboxylate dehydrogenase